MYDIAIIGAGPAGATLARLLGGTYRVLLVDRRPLDGERGSFLSGKCCGGLLAPDAQRMLSELGMGLPRDILEGPQLFVVKAIDTQRGLERSYQRHYINIDRRRFDSWILSMVPPGVDIRPNCRFKNYETANESLTLRFVCDNRPLEEKAKILIGADGASSRVRLQAAEGLPSPDRYFAIQEWVESTGSMPYFTSVFDSDITDYYSWTIPKGDLLLIGAALPPRRTTSERFGLLKEKLQSCGIRFGNTVRREGAYIMRPTRMAHLCTGADRVALIGEAAGWISPSSAEGISYAFRSARALAEALQPGLEGFRKRYRARTRAIRRNILVKIMKAHFIFNPTLRKAVMKLGLNSVELYNPTEESP